MDKEIYDKLKLDEHYYGEFGQQYLSNSNIKTILNDPANLNVDKGGTNPAFLVGGYFHTSILEPEKLKNFKKVDASTRNTNKYKEEAKDEPMLLKHEADNADKMVEAIMANDICRDLIKPLLGNVDYEEPAIAELFGNQWKGKADIINHDEKLVIDLKTTGEIDKFRWSASKYNYDSQAYIYSKLFGYDMLFIVIDKKSHKIGIFECSPEFYKRGAQKVKQASEAYDLYFKSENFDFKQIHTTEML